MGRVSIVLNKENTLIIGNSQTDASASSFRVKALPLLNVLECFRDPIQRIASVDDQAERPSLGNGIDETIGWGVAPLGDREVPVVARATVNAAFRTMDRSHWCEDWVLSCGCHSSQ